MTTTRCVSCLGHCGRTALTLWAVAFVALLCVTCPKASAAIEPGRGAGAEFEVLESRSRHDITLLVAMEHDSTGVPTAKPASSYSDTRGTVWLREVADAPDRRVVARPAGPPRGELMLAVLYRWRTMTGLEEQFVDGWERVTRAIHSSCGSYGSRLHRAADGTRFGYARCPDAATASAATRPGRGPALDGQGDRALEQLSAEIVIALLDEPRTT